jgi:hypothetical protein
MPLAGARRNTREKLMQSQTFKLLFLALGVAACSGEAEESVEELGTAEQAITATIDFQDGTVMPGQIVYKGTRDSRLVANDPNTSYGSDKSCLVSPAGSGNEQSCVLLFFNLRNFIPASAISQSGRLTLNVTDSSRSSVSINTLRKHWKELDANWIRANSLEPWKEAGAKSPTEDRGELVRTFTALRVGAITMDLGAVGVAKVQEALSLGDGVVNGFILSGAGTTDPFGYDSSEADLIAKRPRLSVTYIN